MACDARNPLPCDRVCRRVGAPAPCLCKGVHLLHADSGHRAPAHRCNLHGRPRRRAAQQVPQDRRLDRDCGCCCALPGHDCAAQENRSHRNDHARDRRRSGAQPFALCHCVGAPRCFLRLLCVLDLLVPLCVHGPR
eukprot:Amastigsp_a339616_2070.p2 type:complete len:136 gc:universal Amastigsp_a339616_2070:1261-854(-)